MEAVGRVFAAVPLAPDARLELADQVGELAIPGRLVRPENWHLTLRFLGTVDEPTYERFIHVLGMAELPEPFKIALDGIGGFPNERKAAAVWVGVARGADRLGELNLIAEDAAQAAGLAPEERPYRPHLSLARVRPPEPIGHLSDAGLNVGYTADRVVVYRSHLGRGGARYEPLDEVELSR